ncbi:MAG: hypothetical protein HQK62_04990 [Desulfamplus sp.]|nr:hypothetical protein [Desulfamplus sp.]
MIPKFDIIHTGLHSSYLSFDRYKLFLQNQAFSGYLKLEDSHTQCFFFIKEGKDIASFCISDNSFKEFNPSEIPSVLKNPFFISSYRAPNQAVDFFARCHNAKSIYENITFNSIVFDKFFSQIESKKITGFLQAAKNGDPKRYIYFYGGKIFGYMNIKGSDGVFEKNLDKSQIQTALKNSTMTVYLISASSAGSVAKKHSHSPVPHTVSKPKVSQYDTKAASSGTSGIDSRNLVLKCYEEIFQMLEKDADLAEFTSIWRTAALELSNKYLFLNPFAGEFSYDNSKIDLWEEVDIKTAVHALDELSNAIAKKANIPKDGIKSIKDSYLNILVAYEIRN